jgi:hypothetical protein
VVVLGVCLTVVLATVGAVELERSGSGGTGALSGQIGDPGASDGTGSGTTGAGTTGAGTTGAGTSTGNNAEADPTDSGLSSAGARVPGPTSKQDAGPADPAEAIDSLLRSRVTAVRTGNGTAWLAPLDSSGSSASKSFRSTQTQLFDRISSLHPAAWSYRVTGAEALSASRRAQLADPKAWLAEVQLTYQLVTGGPVVHRQQFLTIVRRDGSNNAGSNNASSNDTWRIAADTDGPTTRDIWDLGPIAHATSSRCLVIGTRARQSQIAQLAAECGTAATVVDHAWGTAWPRQTVLTVPKTLPQLALLLGRTKTPDATAGLANTAAVTIGPADAAAEQVLINGAAFDQLRAIGRRVVLTHELVHVATRATGSRSAPTWLEEGFADYVAYAGTNLTPDQIAGEELDAVRNGAVPARLPSSDDFNAAGNGAALAYGQAWVAVRLIAGRTEGDRARLKAFYQQAAVTSTDPRSTILDAALARLGLRDTAAFVPLWQAQLRSLAAGR